MALSKELQAKLLNPDNSLNITAIASYLLWGVKTISPNISLEQITQQLNDYLFANNNYLLDSLRQIVDSLPKQSFGVSAELYSFKAISGLLPQLRQHQQQNSPKPTNQLAAIVEHLRANLLTKFSSFKQKQLAETAKNKLIQSGINYIIANIQAKQLHTDELSNYLAVEVLSYESGNIAAECYKAKISIPAYFNELAEIIRQFEKDLLQNSAA